MVSSPLNLRIGVIGTAEMPSYLVDNLKLAGLNAVLIPWKRFSLYRYLPLVDVVVFIFPINKLRLIRTAKMLGKITIAKWIGSDVMFGLGERWNELKQVLRFIDIHISDAPLLDSELMSGGIRSFLIPIVPPDLRARPISLPDNFRLLTYIIKGKEEFYRAEVIGGVARRLKDVEFIVVEDGIVPNASSNVRHIGLVSRERMEAIYADTTAFIRLPTHDGISMSVLEALSYGRYVIRSIPFPACIYAVNEDEIVASIDGLRGVRDLNYEGLRFVEEVVSPTRLAGAWRALFKNLYSAISGDEEEVFELKKGIDVM